MKNPLMSEINDYLIHSDSDYVEFLAHYGVRGMRWGVRRKLTKLRTSEERQAYLDERDKRWINKVNSNPKTARVAKRAARRMKREVLPKLKEEFKGINLKRDAYAKSQYDAKAKSAMISILDRESYRAHRMSPSRTREVMFEPQTDGTLKAVIVARDNVKLTAQRAKIAKIDRRRDRAEVRTIARAKAAEARAAAKAKAAEQKATEIKHAASDFDPDDDPYVGMVFSIKLDALGQFEDFEFPFEDEMMQSDIYEVENFLTHYGIPGMKWGVRRVSPKVSTPTTISIKDRKRPIKEWSQKRKEALTPVSDSSKAWERKKLYKMDNKELRERLNRLNMEQQYRNLTDDTSPMMKAVQVGGKVGLNLVKANKDAIIKDIADKKNIESILKDVVTPANVGKAVLDTAFGSGGGKKKKK